MFDRLIRLVRRDEIELVDEYTESLQKKGEPRGELHQADDKTHGLLNMARTLHSTLVPVEPDASFVAELKAQLMAAHQQRQQFVRQTISKSQRPIFLVPLVAGVALFTSVVGSVLAVVMIVRRRSRGATPA